MINKVNLYEHISENINKYSNIKKIKDDIIINTNSKRISYELREKISDHLFDISLIHNKINNTLSNYINIYKIKRYPTGKLTFLKHNKIILNNEYKDYIFTLIDEHGELLYKLQDPSNYE